MSNFDRLPKKEVEVAEEEKVYLTESEQYAIENQAGNLLTNWAKKSDTEKEINPDDALALLIKDKVLDIYENKGKNELCVRFFLDILEERINEMQFGDIPNAREYIEKTKLVYNAPGIEEELEKLRELRKLEKAA